MLFFWVGGGGGGFRGWPFLRCFVVFAFFGRGGEGEDSCCVFFFFFVWGEGDQDCNIPESHTCWLATASPSGLFERQDISEGNGSQPWGFLGEVLPRITANLDYFCVNYAEPLAEFGLVCRRNRLGHLPKRVPFRPGAGVVL